MLEGDCFSPLGLFYFIFFISSSLESRCYAAVESGFLQKQFLFSKEAISFTVCLRILGYTCMVCIPSAWAGSISWHVTNHVKQNCWFFFINIWCFCTTFFGKPFYIILPVSKKKWINDYSFQRPWTRTWIKFIVILSYITLHLIYHSSCNCCN